jgi:hypothetical protein
VGSEKGKKYNNLYKNSLSAFQTAEHLNIQRQIGELNILLRFYSLPNRAEVFERREMLISSEAMFYPGRTRELPTRRESRIFFFFIECIFPIKNISWRAKRLWSICGASKPLAIEAIQSWAMK